MAKKSLDKWNRQELLAEVRRRRHRYRLWEKGLDAITGILKAAFQWGSIGWLGYCALRASEALAGETTLAEFGFSLKLLGNIKVSVALAWTWAIAMTFRVVRERKLRRSVIARHHQDKARLERLIDPARSSSMLTPEGDTRPEDQQP